jgi:alpha/beta superfamily hydrolase
MITTIMAGFAFGYCIADIILTRRANKRLSEDLKRIIDGELNK